METKLDHSPAPWDVVEANDHHGFYIEDTLGNTVCDLYFKDTQGVFHHPYNALGSAKINAHVIKAAPKMLDALERIADFLDGNMSVPQYIYDAINDARGENAA